MEDTEGIISGISEIILSGLIGFKVEKSLKTGHILLVDTQFIIRSILSDDDIAQRHYSTVPCIPGKAKSIFYLYYIRAY